MTVFNIGSINIDHLYQVDHFVRPGETLASAQYQQLLGGKGANQSIAIARAGGEVKHIGAIHQSDDWVLSALQSHGVDTSLVSTTPTATGHAIIQLTPEAENAIILFPGANHTVALNEVERILTGATDQDWVLMQNETNDVVACLQLAANTSAKVAFNPAPMDVEITRAALPYIDFLIVNEVEAMDLTQTQSVADASAALAEQFPNLAILLTLGKEGVRYLQAGIDEFTPAFVVEAVDTTAAGDTFIGNYLAAIATGLSTKEAMVRGCAASALCVTKLGAADSIPLAQEVDQFLAQHANL